MDFILRINNSKTIYMMDIRIIIGNVYFINHYFRKNECGQCSFPANAQVHL